MNNDKCSICRGKSGSHKMTCPNRPGYGDRVIISVPSSMIRKEK